MITIIHYSAFNKAHREVFVKGESFAQIHETLNSMCSTYHVMEILQGNLENIALKELTIYQDYQTKIRPTDPEREVLLDALRMLRAIQLKAIPDLKISDEKCVQIGDMIDEKVKLIDGLTAKLLKRE